MKPISSVMMLVNGTRKVGTDQLVASLQVKY